jgi:hypothetical protein
MFSDKAKQIKQNEVNKVADRGYPVGKAQQMVLDALGKRASTFQEAEAIFESLGIVVSSRREGRSSVPVITEVGFGGGWNPGGDGDDWRGAKKSDLAAVRQWMKD